MERGSRLITLGLKLDGDTARSTWNPSPSDIRSDFMVVNHDSIIKPVTADSWTMILA